MTCYYPITAFKCVNPDDGTIKVIFGMSDKYKDYKMLEEIKVPCGKCIGCRLDYSRNWAIRCAHEASLHPHNCFITLTLNNEYLLKECQGGDPRRLASLNKKTMQDFWKRFRKNICSPTWCEKYGIPFDPDRKIRYYQCGEYGEQFGRPHYHAIVFGFDFPDRVFFKQEKGVKLYLSKALSSLWSDPEKKDGEGEFGFVTVGDVSFESCAYVARYVMKKVGGKDAKEHYRGRLPEYVCMSRRPGIARDWIERYASDVYPDDLCLMRKAKTGKIMRLKPPRYYDSIYDTIDPDGMRAVVARRKDALTQHNSKDGTPERLASRELVKRSQVSQLKRSLHTLEPLEAIKNETRSVFDCGFEDARLRSSSCIGE